MNHDATEMISAANLSEEQVSAIKEWAGEGASLSDIQKRLKGQFGLNATYMDARFLILDLGIEIRSEADEEASAEPEPAEGNSLPGDQVEIIDPVQAEVPAGSVKFTTDEIARPGAMASGAVTFSDGVKAVWLIDEYGRPGLEPETPGYQPTEEDLGELEKHLRALLQG